MKLDNENLNTITGGGKGLWLAIAGFGIFIVGVFDGFMRPLKCNK